MGKVETLKDLDKQAFAKRAKEVYNRKYRKNLEAHEEGKVVAIEVESEDVFIARTALEAGMKAREKHPDKPFYFIRVGYPAVHSLKSPSREAFSDQTCPPIPTQVQAGCFYKDILPNPSNLS